MSLLLPAGTAGDGTDAVVITPEIAGWRYCGLRVVRLEAGARRNLSTTDEELAVLPLAGSAVVETGGRRFELAGRASVFDRVTDWAYVPIESEVSLSSDHPTALEGDRTRTIQLLRRFASPDARCVAHPIFGPLTRDEWMVWGYRHVDHHLRQFGH